MNHSKTLTLGFLLATISLTACSGLGNVCHTNCTVNGGTATLSLTLQAKPLALPPNTNILSYVVTIGGVTLTPVSGSTINIQNAQTFDLTRLQSDSAFLGVLSTSIPAGTYTSLTVALTGATVTYCTVTAGVPGCTASSVAQVTGGVAAPIITFPNGGLVLTSDEKAGLSVVFDMGATLTVSSQHVVTAVNLAPLNVNILTTVTLGSTHASSLATNQLDYLDDVTGTVSVTGNQVTVATAQHGSITATADSNTFYSPGCTALGFALSVACVKSNAVASINAILNADGTMKLISYDPFPVPNATVTDWLEGVVSSTPTVSGQFFMVANYAVVSASGTLLPSPVPVGSPIIVNLTTGANAAIFGVDTQGLNVPADATNFQGTLAATALLPGQTVAVHVTNFNLAGGLPGGIVVTADAVQLRFTRVAGSAASPGSTNNFSLSATSLPPFFGFTTVQELVQLTNGTPPATNSTVYDGVTVSTNITSGSTYSIRALYFGENDAEPFVAAKVRQNP
jgi:hypothetical protein